MNRPPGTDPQQDPRRRQNSAIFGKWRRAIILGLEEGKVVGRRVSSGQVAGHTSSLTSGLLRIPLLGKELFFSAMIMFNPQTLIPRALFVMTNPLHDFSPFLLVIFYLPLGAMWRTPSKRAGFRLRLCRERNAFDNSPACIFYSLKHPG